METRTLPRYQSHKHVSALKIQHVTLQPGDGPNDVVAHIFFEDASYPPIHVPLFGKPTPHKGWYYVIYDAVDDDREPYESFSPPEAFEKGYSPIPVERGGIGWAVQQLHNGHRVCRAGWNGKGMWLGYVPGDQWGLGSHQNAFDYGAAGPGKLLPWVGMRTAQGDFVPWLASHTDLLATDWEIAG